MLFITGGKTQLKKTVNVVIMLYVMMYCKKKCGTASYCSETKILDIILHFYTSLINKHIQIVGFLNHISKQIKEIFEM